MTNKQKKALRLINGLGVSDQSDLESVVYLLSDILSVDVIRMLIKFIKDYGYRSKFIDVINVSNIDEEKKEHIIKSLNKISRKFQ